MRTDLLSSPTQFYYDNKKKHPQISTKHFISNASYFTMEGVCRKIVLKFPPFLTLLLLLRELREAGKIVTRKHKLRLNFRINFGCFIAIIKVESLS